MQQHSDRNNANEAANRGHGPQGIDKAPGEETPQDIVPFTQESQKGKSDIHPPNESDNEPATQEDL